MGKLPDKPATFYRPNVAATGATTTDLSVQDGRSAYLFSGVVNVAIPGQLMLDPCLTPVEKCCWIAFRMLMCQNNLAIPKYADLQPFLAMTPMGDNTSRGTVARAVINLRLCRWITLMDRRRDAVTGQMLGCMYMLHDEPITVSETLKIDPCYVDLVIDALTHANKSVRILAEMAKASIEKAGETLPTRLEILSKRTEKCVENHCLTPKLLPSTNFVHGKNELSTNSVHGENELSTNFVHGENELSTNSVHGGNELSTNSVHGENELSTNSVHGENELSTNSVLGQKQPSTNLIHGHDAPSTKFVLGEESQKIDRVRNSYANSTVQYCTDKYLSTSTDTKSLRQRLLAIGVNSSDLGKVEASLSSLTDEVSQAVLAEVEACIKARRIHKPAGFLWRLIEKAKRGEFKSWAARPTLELAGKNTPTIFVAQQQDKLNQATARQALKYLQGVFRDKNGKE